MNDKHVQYQFLLRAIILLVSSILLFLFLTWVPESVQAANSSAHLQGFPNIRIQETPTVDPTITTLEKENLEHQDS